MKIKIQPIPQQIKARTKVIRVEGKPSRGLKNDPKDTEIDKTTNK